MPVPIADDAMHVHRDPNEAHTGLRALLRLDVRPLVASAERARSGASFPHRDSSKAWLFEARKERTS
jgi:hypothetical protein